MDYISIVLNITYILLGVAVLAAIVLPIFNAISNPKTLLGSAVGVASLVVIFLISYMVAGDEITKACVQFGVDASQSKFIGGILNMTYGLIGVALLAMFGTMVNKVFK